MAGTKNGDLCDWERFTTHVISEKISRKDALNSSRVIFSFYHGNVQNISVIYSLVSGISNPTIFKTIWTISYSNILKNYLCLETLASEAKFTNALSKCSGSVFPGLLEGPKHRKKDIYTMLLISARPETISLHWKAKMLNFFISSGNTQKNSSCCIPSILFSPSGFTVYAFPALKKQSGFRVGGIGTMLLLTVWMQLNCCF